MVTNPLSRDWTVTASLFATLNDMYGNRTVCGIGRGDSAVRVPGGRPANLETLAEAMRVIRGLASGETRRVARPSSHDPLGRKRRARRLHGRLRAEGARARRARSRRAHPAARRPLPRRVVGAHRPRGPRGGERAAGPYTVCVAAPAYVGDDLAHQRDQVRWFGGMVGNHVADLVDRYGERSGGGARGAHRLHRSAPTTTTPTTAKPATPRPTSCPTRSSTASAFSDRSAAHIERMEELASLGVDQFAIYLMHDAQESTLDAYGSHVIPHFA